MKVIEPKFFYVDGICYQFVGLHENYTQHHEGGSPIINIVGNKIKISGRVSNVNYYFSLDDLSKESQPDYLNWIKEQGF